MADLKYLRLLAQDYPTEASVHAELVRLKGLGDLPKGTEYFFSDVHGEYVGFAHMLRSASGNIRRKIEELFDGELDEVEQNRLANLVYAPERVLAFLRDSGASDRQWQHRTISNLVSLCRHISTKYRRSSIEARMPGEYAAIIRELLFVGTGDEFRRRYDDRVIGHIVESELVWPFIVALCEMIQRVVVNRVHIIGDIFDRGANPHLVMEELIRFGDVDVQWGNHDVHWMGAAAGSQVSMCSVLRAGISYNTFDAFEYGYGFNLRALSTFAAAMWPR